MDRHSEKVKNYLLEAFETSFKNKKNMKNTRLHTDIEAIIRQNFGTNDVLEEVISIKRFTSKVIEPNTDTVKRAKTNRLTAANFEDISKKKRQPLSDLVADKPKFVSKVVRATEITDEELDGPGNENDDGLDSDKKEILLQLLALDDTDIVQKFGTFRGFRTFAKDVVGITIPNKKVEGIKAFRDEAFALLNEGGEDKTEEE